jgi:membrane protease YdiL (CAAX protease family)
MHYYDRETHPSGRWYEWIIVLWMTIVTWILGQLILTGPFQGILASIDPERAQMATDMMATEMEAAGLGFWLLLFVGFTLCVLGLLLGVIGLLVHYLGARGKASLVTGLIGVFLTFAGLIPIFMSNSVFAESSSELLSVIGLSPLAYALMLLTFPAALVGLYLGWTKVKGRSLTSLHTIFIRFRWGRVIQSFLIGWAVLAAFSFGASLLGFSTPRFIFDASRFLPFALLSLLLLPVQSATEEIVVRGFMNKGLIQFLGNKWVAFTLTSGLFMALHLSNPEARAGADAGILPIVMSGYFFFGFAACLMVLIDDGLESAIGVHAANNTFAAIFVNYENSVLPTPSVWQVSPDATGSAISTILVLSMILGLLWVTRKRWEIERAPRPTRMPTVPETFS